VKILFINVSRHWDGRVYKEYPHGIGILATLTQKLGHVTCILDMIVDDTSPIEVIEKFIPDVIALSVVFPALNAAFKLIDDIKPLFIGHLVSGGVHTSLYPIEMIEKGVHVAVIGEGENIWPQLLECFEKRSSSSYDDSEMASIHGIAYRSKSGSIVQTNKRECSVDLA
jgi:radical SAM superfamily enzyme YgiQ (UPF0313 family)